MILRDQTAYPQIDNSLSAQQITELFKPTIDELSFVKNHAKDITGRVTLLTLLKTFQHLGYFPAWREIPEGISTFLCGCLGHLFAAPLPDTYDKSGSRSRHMRFIRQYLDIKPIGLETYKCMDQSAWIAAQTKEHLADIINVMIEQLVCDRFELPAFSRFHRRAIDIRNKVNEACFKSVCEQINHDQKLLLDQWLVQKNEHGMSWWQRLKYEPGNLTVRNIRSFIKHVDWLNAFSSQLDISINIPQAKRTQFTYQAYACDLPHLQQLIPDKRYTFMVLLLERQVGIAMDHLVLMLIRTMYKIKNTAQTTLNNYHEKNRDIVGTLIETLSKIGSAFQSRGTDQERFNAIVAVMPPSPDEMIQLCDTHTAYVQNNYLLCLLPHYKIKRGLIYGILQQLQLCSSTQDKYILDAISIMTSHWHSRKEWIELPDGMVNMNWITEKWRKLIFDKKSPNLPSTSRIHQRYYELCTLFEIVRQLKSGDLYLSNSIQFDDYTKNLITWEEYHQQLPHFETVSAIPTNPIKFVDRLKAQLLEVAQLTDETFPNNPYTHVKDGQIVISKITKKRHPKKAAIIDQEFRKMIPRVSLLQLIAYMERALNLHQDFHHLSGSHTRVKDYRNRFVSTLFCYGSLMGPVQAARSIHGISRKQLAWIHDQHISELRLDGAITKVIDAYSQFQLPRVWGSGRSVSADGTHWATYQKNMFAQYHLRYGAYGGVGYYHVSDTYIAICSHFIPCGVYEAVFILDGLINNDLPYQTDMVHGDTHAQNTVVFGLAYLLGIKLMPRIRNIKGLSLFKPHRSHNFTNIDSLFSEVIRWDLIQLHLPDMLRIVMSIMSGKITPSTILRRLGSQNNKSKIYYAFRELGRAVRTIFLLEYIRDVDLRKLIFAATNKSEEFNQFADWIAFASKTIPENLQHQQTKIIKYNHLIANLIMLYNVNEMTRIINELKNENMPLSTQVLQAFSPYRTEHINRFGSYAINDDTEPQKLFTELNLNI